MWVYASFMITLGFWGKIQKPFFVLAPMADVTDYAFREMFAKYGPPDVFFTEFVSADGLCSEKGREKLLIDLKFSPRQRPIVAQIFTSKPENARRAASLCAELGFDGVDINMGCPERKIEKQGAGAALMKTPKLAQEVLRAAKAGAGKLPVSVKTRLGYTKDELETWLPYVLECEPAAVTIHARTRKDMSKIPARWERVTRAVEIRDKIFSGGGGPLIIGNGDVGSFRDARERIKECGADGVMVGRAAFGNPWFFTGTIPPFEERLCAMAEHAELFEKIFGGVKNFGIMKKHFKAYASGFPGASGLRAELMKTSSAAEVRQTIQNSK